MLKPGWSEGNTNSYENTSGIERACANPICKFYTMMVHMKDIEIYVCEQPKVTISYKGKTSEIEAPTIKVNKFKRHQIKYYVDHYTYNYLIVCDTCMREVNHTLKNGTEEEVAYMNIDMNFWGN